MLLLKPAVLFLSFLLLFSFYLPADAGTFLIRKDNLSAVTNVKAPSLLKSLTLQPHQNAAYIENEKRHDLHPIDVAVLTKQDFSSGEYQAELFIKKINDWLEKHPGQKMNIIWATGGTMEPFWEALIRKRDQVDWSRTRAFHLDEYYGLPKEHPQSYRYTLEKNVFEPLGIPVENRKYLEEYLDDPQKYIGLLKSLGGAHLALLGIGSNGHIAFNEPGSLLSSGIRKVKLKESTKRDNKRFFVDEKGNLLEPGVDVPTHAVTMGIQDILNSEEILLFANGTKKATAIYQSLLEEPTPQVPASFVQTHPKVNVVLDYAAATGLIKMMESPKNRTFDLREKGSLLFIPEAKPEIEENHRIVSLEHDVFQNKKVFYFVESEQEMHEQTTITPLIDFLKQKGKEQLETFPVSNVNQLSVKELEGAIFLLPHTVEAGREFKKIRSRISEPLTVFWYKSLKQTNQNEHFCNQVNLLLPGSSEDMVLLQQAIQLHQTQNWREGFPFGTKYDKAVFFGSILNFFRSQRLGYDLEHLSRSVGITKVQHAQWMKVDTIDESGNIQNSEDDVKFQVVFDQKQYEQAVAKGYQPIFLEELLISSPHPDDDVINLGLLVIAAMKAGVPIESVIFSTGKNAVKKQDPLFQDVLQKMMSFFVNNEETGIPFLAYFQGYFQQKREAKDSYSTDEVIDLIAQKYRTFEADNSLQFLKKSLKSSSPLRVENQELDLFDYEEDYQTIKDRKREWLEQKLKAHLDRNLQNLHLPFSVVMAHPSDNHYTHRRDTQVTREILSELAKEYQVKVNLLYFVATWQGQHNTYVILPKEREWDKKNRISEDNKQMYEAYYEMYLRLIPELVMGFSPSGDRLVPSIKSLSGIKEEEAVGLPLFRQTFFPASEEGPDEQLMHLLSS